MDISIANKEFSLPEVDCLCVFGRGIEMLPGSRTWVPVGLLQRVPLQRGATRSVVREDIDPDNAEGFIAQCEANIEALVLWLKELINRQQQLPKLVIISAGRPKYLEDAIARGLAPTGFSESAPMLAILNQALPDLEDQGVKVITITDNTNTEQDVVNSVKAVSKHGLKTMAVINTMFAMPRTQVFHRANFPLKIDDMYGANSTNPAVVFAASEDVLMRNMTREAATRYENDMYALCEKPAGIRSLHGEMIGTLRAMRRAYDRANAGKY